MADLVPDPYARLRALGLALPPAPAPIAAYVPVRVVDLGQGRAMLFISGQVAMRDGRPLREGRVPDVVSVEEAADNARQCALNLLAQVDAVAGLANVEQVVQVNGFVQSANGFSEQPRVINGASDLIQAVLGDAGRHSRVAVGVNALPLNVPVEVSATVLVRGIGASGDG